MASAIQIEVLVRSNLPIGARTSADFFERAATCVGQIAGLQEEIGRIFNEQAEKGKETQA